MLIHYTTNWKEDNIADTLTAMKQFSIICGRNNSKEIKGINGCDTEAAWGLDPCVEARMGMRRVHYSSSVRIFYFCRVRALDSCSFGGRKKSPSYA
jgi:hypothetical protein